MSSTNVYSRSDSSPLRFPVPNQAFRAPFLPARPLPTPFVRDSLALRGCLYPVGCFDTIREVPGRHDLKPATIISCGAAVILAVLAFSWAASSRIPTGGFRDPLGATRGNRSQAHPRRTDTPAATPRKSHDEAALELAVAHLWRECGYRQPVDGQAGRVGLNADELTDYVELARRKHQRGGRVALEVRPSWTGPRWSCNPISHAELALCVDEILQFAGAHPDLDSDAFRAVLLPQLPEEYWLCKRP